MGFTFTFVVSEKDESAKKNNGKKTQRRSKARLMSKESKKGKLK
jgi:hypothetical protein